MTTQSILRLATSIFFVPVVFFICMHNESDAAAVVFNDGLTTSVSTDIRPDFIQVLDSPDGDPTTVEIDPGAFVGTDEDSDTSFNVSDNSIGKISGGEIENDVEADGNAQIDIYGGIMHDDVEAFGAGTINIYGGTVRDDVEAFGAGTINIYGGEVVEDVEAFANGVINIFGGDLNTDPVSELHSGLASEQNGMITLYGWDFAVNGSGVVEGPIALLSGTISGTLQDGNGFSTIFVQQTPGNIRVEVVPEPSSIALLGFGAVGLIGYSWRRRKQCVRTLID